MEQRRTSRGSEAARGTGFPAKAMGERATVKHSANADRSEAGVAPSNAAGSGKPAVERGGAPYADRRIRGDAARAESDCANRPLGCERADHRRTRHRERGRGENAARDVRQIKPPD